MSVRPHPSKGDGWWYIDVGYDKNRQRYPFSGTHAEALQYEREIRKLVKPGPPTTNPRLSEIADDYLAWYKVNHLDTGYTRQVYSIQHIKRHFGTMLLGNITPPIVERYKADRLGAGISRSTINKELSALGSLLRWAKEQGHIDTCQRIAPFAKRLTRAPLPNVPDRATVDAIIDHIPADRRGLFRLMFYCGLRRNEATTLKAEHIVTGKKMLLITGKGGKQRPVPVPRDDLWQEIIDRGQQINWTGYLWTHNGQPWRDLRGSLEAAASKAGWPGRIYPHLLRHAYGTELITSGTATLRDVQQLMGHSSSQVTEIYTHLSADRLTAVANSLTGDVKNK